MTAGKKKVSKAPASRALKSAALPRPALPSLPIPDFDHVGFVKLCDEVEALAKDSSKALVKLLAMCEEIRTGGALEVLAQSERVGAAIELLQSLKTGLPSFLAATNKMRAGLDEWEAGERRSRRARFEKIAQVWNWQIVGSWPEPVVNQIVFVAVDEQKDRGTVNGRVVTGKPTAEHLACAVAEELATLQQNVTEPKDFIAQVWKAYAGCSANSNTGVQVHDLLAELTWQRQSKGFQRDPRTELFRGYSLAQFRADLTQYLASGAPSIEDGGKSYELQVVGGSFAQDGVYMYFPQADRLATCGRLSFQPVAAGLKK